MSYAIIRNANYKRDNLAGLYKHNERKNTNYSNKDINRANSVNNYSLKQCNTTYANAIKILQQENNLKGRIIKTTNIACEFIITSDKDFFDNIGEEETKRYFQTAYNFVANYKNLGEKYILSAKIHLDESTPHMHIVFIPVVHTKDKQGNTIDKIACSEYWKGQDSYRQLQDNFHKYITKNGFALERGKQREVEHLSIEKLKQVTDYENIKYEITHEQVQPTNTQDMALVIAQNKQLVQYINKLKTHLSKSYKAIETMETLKKENANLHYENQKLRQENFNLRNYIANTFEVVKHLFDFPKDRLKRLVDGFIQDFNKKKH